jgi:predicted O-methyltransferase YrrM
MSENQLIESLLLKKPYFGSAMRALQGDPERHRYMGAVIRYLKARNTVNVLNVLEVGSWAGASAVTWVESLKQASIDGHVMCIDPWEPFLDVKNNPDRHYQEMENSLETGTIFNLFLHNIETTGNRSRVKIAKGRSSEILPKIEPNTYDIIYIDGAHDYKGVEYDLKKAADIIPEGGIICGDDLEIQMDRINKDDLMADVAHGFDYTQDKTSGINYHPGVTRAVGETFGIVGEWHGFWAVRKEKERWSIPDIEPYVTATPEHLVPYLKTSESSENLSLDSYNVFSFQGRFTAVSKNIGTIDPMERVGNTEIFPLILVGDSKEEILAKVEKAEKTGLGAHLELVEQSEHYNYIRMGKRLFAVSTGLGPVDLMAALGTANLPPYIIQGQDENAVRESVKHHIDIKKMQKK